MKFPWERPKPLKIERIVRQENRALLFGEDDWYYIIAPKEFAGKVGDTVFYEPYGVNCGFLLAGKDGVR